MKNSKQPKAPGKAKNGKPSSPKNAASIRVKKSKDASAGSVVSNGSIASQPRTKQTSSLGTKSKSFNDRKTADTNSKPIVARVNVSHAKVKVHITVLVLDKNSSEHNSLFTLSSLCASVSLLIIIMSFI